MPRSNRRLEREQVSDSPVSSHTGQPGAAAGACHSHRRTSNIVVPVARAAARAASLPAIGGISYREHLLGRRRRRARARERGRPSAEPPFVRGNRRAAAAAGPTEAGRTGTRHTSWPSLRGQIGQIRSAHSAASSPQSGRHGANGAGWFERVQRPAAGSGGGQVAPRRHLPGPVRAPPPRPQM